MLPNFLIIGAAKAGTTALWHYLRQHPQVYMSPHKEPRYFALCGGPIDFRGPGDTTTFRFVTEFSEYEALFDGVKGELAIGEASPWYLYVDSAAPAIRERLPEVKLVAILREPVERAYSNYLHAFREGLEPLATFGEAMEAESERIRARWSPRFHYRQKGFYHCQLSHYLEYFERDKLRIYLYDDFVASPDTLMRDLYAFLGVDAGISVAVQDHVNVAWVPRSPSLAKALREGNRLTRAVGRVMSGTMREVVKRTMRALNRGPKPVLSQEDRERFCPEYREDILRLQDLLGRELDQWLNVGDSR